MSKRVQAIGRVSNMVVHLQSLGVDGQRIAQILGLHPKDLGMQVARKGHYVMQASRTEPSVEWNETCGSCGLDFKVVTSPAIERRNIAGIDDDGMVWVSCPQCKVIDYATGELQ